MKLLNIQNAKTVKGNKRGYLTGILYLASSDESGYQVCPMAKKAGCEAPCLDFAGRGKFARTRASRIRKTRLYFENRRLFLEMLRKDIKALIRKADRENLTPCVRLNGTSDLPWYEIIEEFPNLQFYDYTKIARRFINVSNSTYLSNYHMTFSAGKHTTDIEITEHLRNGRNVAIVFNEKFPRDTALIDYLYQPVVDGDKTDLRFLDPKGVIVALTATGKALKEKGGFVRNVNNY